MQLNPDSLKSAYLCHQCALCRCYCTWFLGKTPTFLKITLSDQIHVVCAPLTHFAKKLIITILLENAWTRKIWGGKVDDKLLFKIFVISDPPSSHTLLRGAVYKTAMPSPYSHCLWKGRQQILSTPPPCLWVTLILDWDVSPEEKCKQYPSKQGNFHEILFCWKLDSWRIFLCNATKVR